MTDKITQSEKDDVAEALEESTTFPTDGIGNVWYGGYDNQELQIDVKKKVTKSKI